MSTIRVLLADDPNIARDGLKTLIEKETGMEVIAGAENGRKMVQLAQKLRLS
jgi:YesN/AraC family two-component response regulator